MDSYTVIHYLCLQDAEIDQVLCSYKLHNGRYAVCKEKKLRGGEGCASLTVELVRHFLTVFRC
jgi:hypothetical protein